MTLTQVLLTIIGSVVASGGFWAYVGNIASKRSNSNRLLVGLAHDRILSLGTEYIERGYVTPDEYENLYQYIYKPYIDMGGNGSAVRIMERVKSLPIK